MLPVTSPPNGLPGTLAPGRAAPLATAAAGGSCRQGSRLDPHRRLALTDLDPDPAIDPPADPALAAIVLAAGEGTRMRSTRPKPLHLLCGRAMLLHVLDALGTSQVRQVVVVVGHGAERVTKKLQEEAPDVLLDFVEQHVQRGTGDAASVGLTGFPDDELDEGDVLVLPGDAPLLRPETVAALVARHRDTGAACTVLTARLDDPTGYGRVLRGPDDRVRGIVEQADATDDELAIDEVNTSIYCFRRSVLAPALRRLSPENAQGEYYLTDVVGVLHDAGYPVFSLVAADPAETQGVNDRRQLAVAEAELRRRTNAGWLARGVTMLDPERTYIDSTVELAPDVMLFPGTMLQGRCVVGQGAELGPDTRLVDCAVGAGARLEHVVGRDAWVGEGADVGPFAVLEPGSRVGDGARTGAFYTAQGDG
jgi:bifunctional UDP-N-acetylglucosamine pyrophosphorylase/glucosamine-1-phosphate N-acetyltransferase